MSCNYADGLSPYHDKGQLGLDEKFDSKSVVTAKVALLAKWINEAKHVVVHTGAGISTSAGIPDFRGPRGVWTLQAKGVRPDPSTDFNEAIPTPTHMAITKLVERNKVKYVVSQNIDGLHLRSNVQRKFLSELHGNMFIEQCNTCNRQFVRSGAVHTVGQKALGKACPTVKANGRPCRGRLHDTILDWEHSLPENDLGMADFHSCMSDLSVCLGTTMQIVPSGNLPLYTKKHGGRLVICNLQPTKHDRKADLLIHSYVDEVMVMLMKNLGLKIPKYTAKNDPTKTLSLQQSKFLEWTISDSALDKTRKVYEGKFGTKEAKKRLEMIDDDDMPLLQKIAKRKAEREEDSDLEVLDVIVKGKKPKESSKRGRKKSPAEPPPYTPTITVKKVATPAPPAKKQKVKYEAEKITIKKNVTPTKTKYEIVQPRPAEKPKKPVKCEIVYCKEGDICNDLEMICESDDEDTTNFTYNFKRYLYDEKEVKKEDEEKKNIEPVDEVKPEENKEGKDDTKEEIKTENQPEEAKEEAKSEEVTVETDKSDEPNVEKETNTTEQATEVEAPLETPEVSQEAGKSDEPLDSKEAEPKTSDEPMEVLEPADAMDAITETAVTPEQRDTATDLDALLENATAEITEEPSEKQPTAEDKMEEPKRDEQPIFEAPTAEFAIEQFEPPPEPTLNLPQSTTFNQDSFLDKEFGSSSSNAPDLDYVDNLQFLQ